MAPSDQVKNVVKPQENMPEQRPQREVLTNAPKAGHAQMKDPKSFTQNLFDTVALRMLEWVPLRRPPKSPLPACDPEEQTSADGISHEEDKKSEHLSENDHMRDCEAETFVEEEGSNSEKANGHVLPPEQSSSFLHEENAMDASRPSQGLDQDVDPTKAAFTMPNGQLSSAPTIATTEADPADLSTSRITPSTPSLHQALQPPSRKHRRRGEEVEKTKATKARRSTSLDTTSNPSLPLRTESEESMRDAQAGILDSLATSDLAVSLHLDPSTPINYAETLPHLSAEFLTALRQTMFHEAGDDVVGKWLGGPSNLACNLGFRLDHWSPKYLTRRQQEQIVPFVKQTLFYVFKDPRRILKSFLDLANAQNQPSDGDTLPRLDPRSLLYSFQTIHLLSPYPETLSFLWHALAPLFDPPPGFPHSTQSRLKHAAESQSGSLSEAANHGSRRSHKGSPQSISDADAARICTVVLYALATLVLPTTSCDHNRESWNAFRKIRATDRIFPHTDMEKLEHPCQYAWLLELTDRFENELALRLVDRMVGAINNRLTYYEISRAKAQKAQNLDPTKRKPLNAIQLILRHLQHCHGMKDNLQLPTAKPTGLLALAYYSYDPGQNILPTATLEWLRALLLKEWDGKPRTRRAGTVGSVIQFLAAMYKERGHLGLTPEDFHTAFFAERLDSMDMPVEWLASRPGDNKTIHLLSYSFLFPPAAVVNYFRAMNHSTMSKAYEAALTTDRHAHQMIFSDFISVPNYNNLLQNLKPATSTFLVLTIRRDDVLADAMNQLWKRERRELMRPLKVRMGFQEGEEGLDHGGVQQEFFRVLLAQALDPVYGMFTMDPTTRMLWFKPGSLEPLYKFEMLGLLFSLAIYNSLTLPVTFPLAFYRKLLGLKVKVLEHIVDGWTDLSRGFETLLKWSNGDVADAFTRTYEFSYEAYGTIVDVDMEKVDREAPWPPPKRDKGKEKAKTATFDFPAVANSDDEHALADHEEPGKQVPRKSYPPKSTLSPSLSRKSSIRAPSMPASHNSEASLVTNENRAQFVKDYIFWLTDKSVRPQYERLLYLPRPQCLVHLYA